MRLAGVLVLIPGCRIRFEESPDAAGDAAVEASDAGGCPATYAAQPGLPSHYRIARDGTTWLAAALDCEADGTHLIVVDDSVENAFVRSVIGGIATDHVWIGGGDHVVEGTFGWVTGQPMQFTRWGGAEPNNTNMREDCMEVDSNGLWNDESNHLGAGVYHHICECDGLATMPAAYCNTDLDTDCGTCGNQCVTGTTCQDQQCL